MFWLWAGVAALLLVQVALSVALGAAWSTRRAQRALAAAVARARRDRDDAVARLKARMEADVAALEARMLEERKRVAREFAQRERGRQQELARWRRVALAPAVAALAPPDYSERPSARDLQAILARVSGFAAVEAVVADGGGLLHCGERGAQELAPLGAVAEGLRGALPEGCDGGVSVLLVGEDGRHLICRELPSWPGGMWLIAQAMGRAPSQLAVDSAVALAALRDERPAQGGGGAALRGEREVYGDDSFYGQRLTDEMRAMLGLSGLRGLAVCRRGELVAAVVEGGPGIAVLAQLCQGLEEARTQGAWYMRGGDLLRIEVVLEEGLALTYAPLQPGAQITVCLISEGHQPGPVHVMALTGRIRRLLADVPPPPPRPPSRPLRAVPA